MAGSASFEAICAELGRAKGMDRWTARGMLQLALMDAGLDKATVSATQLGVVIERLLPRQLQSQTGVDVGRVCARLRDVLALESGGEPLEALEG
jgi:hypothetical protein